MTARTRRGWGHIRKLPSTKFQASYVGPDIRRHTAPVTFTVRIDAEGWLAGERRLIERGEWTPPEARMAAARASLTLRQYAQAWLAQRSVKPTTRGLYQALLTQHILPVLGQVELATLTPQTVRGWHATTLTDRPTYRGRAYSLLHAVCATAVTDGLLAANPCVIERAMRTPRRREPVILTVAELARLAEVIEPQRLRALVLLAAWCGLRFGEVTELRRKDVGAGAVTLSVCRGVTHRDGCHIASPKSGRGRVVVVPPHIRADLTGHLDTFVAADAEALLFPPARGGCHLAGRSFRNPFNTALDTIGRPGVRIHDLRHFAGTQTARVASLRETMDRLGHSTVGASLLYQGLVSGRDVQVAEALSKLAETD
jgi:integrase